MRFGRRSLGVGRCIIDVLHALDAAAQGERCGMHVGLHDEGLQQERQKRGEARSATRRRAAASGLTASARSSAHAANYSWTPPDG